MDSSVGERALQIGHVGNVRSGCRGDGETIRVILDTAAGGVERRDGSLTHCIHLDGAASHAPRHMP